MDRKYRITVIGAGDRGNSYMKMLARYYAEQVEFTCVCDLQPERVEKATETYHFLTGSTDYRQAIRESKPDITVVATPAYFHCDIAAFAMENGSHVLTEKPFDLDLAKCFHLKEVSQKTGKSLALGFQYRNMPRYRAMKQAMEEDLLGKNVLISFADVRETRPKTAMHDAQFGNGGPFVDMACHLIDLMRWFYAGDPVRVNAVWKKNSVDRPSLSVIAVKAPDTGVFTVEYENGGTGVVILNWGLPGRVNGKFTGMAMGSEGLIENMHAGNEISIRAEGNQVLTIPDPICGTGEPDMPEKGVFDGLVAEIEGRGKVQASFKEGIMSLATSMAAIRSSVIGSPVRIADILAEKPTIMQCMS